MAATYTPNGQAALNMHLLIDPPTRTTEGVISERPTLGSNNQVIDVIGKGITKIMGRIRVDSFTGLQTFEGAVNTAGVLDYSEGTFTVLFRKIERVQVLPNDIHICNVEFWIVA